MANEEWRDIAGYEGLYQVSNEGRVRSLKHQTKYGPKGGQILNFNTHYKNGYLSVMLWNGKISKRVSVHRLVATAFLPNPDNLPEVNHKDECKDHNYVENLEWCDHLYNNNYGTKPERTMRPVIQLTDDGKFVKKWNSQTEASKYYGVSSGCICTAIKTGHRSAGFRWVYEEDYVA